MEKIVEASEKDPKYRKLLEQVDTGKRSVDSAFCQVTEEIKRDERNEELGKIANLHVPDEITLYQGDFAEIPIAKNSIQLILTNPPYGKEYLVEWKKLGKIAKEVLVPGGFLIAYCGKLYLKTILNMLSRHLEYYWMIVIHLRKRGKVHARHVFCRYRPLLIFYKPPKRLPAYFDDLIMGSGREKQHHRWQ
jgi:hypothetical protein